ncbi:hypothetical protein [Pseudoxanthobacter sp.]|uniref:hypothetical protein n=1 Tax=Pseudoxanthobacter sp. TaxID=1925742 RepID=UPI002FE01177
MTGQPEPTGAGPGASVPDLGPFLHLRRFLSIAHHVPGRIRIRLDMAALAHLPQVDASPFVAFAGRIQGVTATRVNAAALSVVVDYDTARIPMAVWPALLTAGPDEVTAILIRHSA